MHCLVIYLFLCANLVFGSDQRAAEADIPFVSSSSAAVSSPLSGKVGRGFLPFASVDIAIDTRPNMQASICDINRLMPLILNTIRSQLPEGIQLTTTVSSLDNRNLIQSFSLISGDSSSLWHVLQLGQDQSDTGDIRGLGSEFEVSLLRFFSRAVLDIKDQKRLSLILANQSHAINYSYAKDATCAKEQGLLAETLIIDCGLESHILEELAGQLQARYFRLSDVRELLEGVKKATENLLSSR